jgi:hypothetical protein
MADLSLSEKLRGVKEVELSAEIGEGKPITEKATPTMSRTSKKELEAAFARCGLVARGLTKLTQIIMSGEPRLVSDDKKVLEHFQKFIDNIGNVGNNLHWDELLNRIFLDQFIYGESFIEKIQGAEGKPPRIVDLDVVDVKSLDYAKKGEHIALDEYGTPLGYAQELPLGTSITNIKKIEPPEDVTLQGREKWIPKERIAHFMLYNFGSGLRPIGLIEPAYTDVRTFLNLKTAYGEKALTVLFPKVVGYVGDEKHVPTAEATKDLIKKMKQAQYKTEMSLPYYNKLQILEARHPEALLNFLGFFMNEIVISLGLPKPIITGLGEETNRATLNVQTYIMILTTRDIIRKTVKTIERQIFKPIAEREELDTYPTIEWNFQKVEESIKGSLEGGGSPNDQPEEPEKDNP